MKKLFIYSVFLLFTVHVFGQITRLKGVIYAGETREPLAFANFYFGSSNTGFYSDFEGKFDYSTDSLGSDTLICVYMGYMDKVIMLQRDTVNNLDVEMLREEKRISQVQVSIKFNPALKWIKLAQDNRVQNNPDKLEFYSCETYTKNSIAVNNISARLKKGKFGEEIGSMFDTISYISADNKSILPVFLSEVLSDYYFNRNPYLSKEVIKASRVKGIGVQDGTFISQLLGSTFVNYNFYQNSLVVIDKGIPSPIGENSTNLYRYELVNVDKTGPLRVFQIYCEPRVAKDLAFYGYLWIEEVTGALLRLSLELNGNSNLNYIDKLRITQEYTRTNNGAYFNINNRVVVDAREVSTKAAGAVATSTVTSRYIDVVTKRPPKFYDSRVVMLPDAVDKSDSFWINHRHYEANTAEKRIAAKIDSLINLPRVRTYVDVANFLIDGYINLGKIDLGPYYNVVSYNQLEGLRNNIGFRTSAKFSRNWKIEGFTAWGYKDKRLKYSFLADRILYRKKWTKLGVLYKRDVEQIGITDNENYGASLFTAFNLLGSNNLNLNRDARITFGTDIRNGLRVTLSAGNRLYKFEKVGNFNFAWYPIPGDTQVISQSFINSYLTLGVKYAPRNYFLQNDNRRVNFSGIGPEYYFQYIQGIKDILQGQFNYSRFIVGVTYNKVWGSIGRTATNLEFARVFGVLPFPLLNIYVGNQSFIYNTKAYNQMRIFEFITDRSVSAAVEHHFNGLMFNRVPLLKRLKWREILGGKIIYGSLDKANFDLIPKQFGGENVSQFKTFGELPYAEVSAGIENIFKVIRVDAVWRLTYRSADNVRNFGVKASISLGF